MQFHVGVPILRYCFIFIHMNDIKDIIKQVVTEEILKESWVNLDSFYENVRMGTESGDNWFKLIQSLENLINHLNNFSISYPSSLHGPKPNVHGALIQLQMIVKLLSSIKPVIIGTSQIEKDEL